LLRGIALHQGLEFDISASPEQQKAQSIEAINKIRERSPEAAADGCGGAIVAFRKWASIERRYSFTARPI